MLALALFALLPVALAARVQYTISPAAAPNLCLAPSGDEYGTSVVLADCDEDHTLFKYYSKSGKLRNVDNSLCLDVTDGVKENGTPLQAWGCYQCNTHQVFDFKTPKDTAEGTGNHTIQWSGTGFCLDLTDGNATVGAPVQIWPCVDYNTNQIWTVMEAKACDDGALETYNSALAEASAEETPAAAAPTDAAAHRRRNQRRAAHH